MIGNQIADRYQIEAELGAGGMGTVYRAVDTHTKTPVAIKHLKPTMANTDMIERFRREGEALRELNHPNMVKMLNALEENGHHYLVMEFVTGGDLKSLLQKNPLSIEQSLKIALDIADALTRAHKLNIIHRDLKPANVLIDDEGTARLTDFGIARVVNKDRITDADAIVGTIDYLAPETFREGDIDHRADIWAFGVMLFEMLTGDVPFQGDMIVQRIMAITTESPPDLEALCPTAPIALVDLIYRMLEKDCNSRIVSMRHVGASLEDIMRGRSLQKTPPKTRFATPSPEKVESKKYNLPVQTTAFVGRKKEVDDLVKLVDDPKVRFVTLVAPGGMGKSRLAIEVVQKRIESFDNGAYFVELAPLSDLVTIPNAIAESVGYQFQQGSDEPKAQVLKYLGNKQMLLILDNYEHLLEGASLVSEILASAPEIKVIVTSREALNLSGEILYSLGGMVFPDWETPEDALEYDAVKLFMQSATRIRPDFELKAEDLQYIARICRLTQGMPLGIVLAASWVKMLEPSEIAEELTQSADILESQLRDIPERQRSIRTIFNYSWNRLSEQEKSVFMKLSVFRGGFTRKAAQGVSGAGLRTLMSLTNQSLIRRDNDSGRYEIHELLRQYAEEQLENSGELENVRDAHMEYYASALYDIQDALWDGRQGRAVNTVEGDFENVRLAWERAVRQKNASFFDRALESVHRYCIMRSRQRDGQVLIEAAINAIESDTENRDVYCRLLSQVMWSYREKDNEEKNNALRKGLDIARSLGLREVEARCLVTLGESLSDTLPRDEAMQLTEEGLAIYREMGHKNGVAQALHLKGYIVASEGDVDTADKLWQEEYAIAEELNDKYLMAQALLNLGVIPGTKNPPDFAETERITRAAIAIQRELGNKMRVARLLGNLHDPVLWQGNVQLARQVVEEMRNIFIELNAVEYIPYNSLSLAKYDMIQADYDMAKSRIEEAYPQINDRETSPFALMSMGWYHCMQGNSADAYNLFVRSLKNSNTVYHPAFYTELIRGLAYMLPYTGQVERGVALMALALNTPWSFPNIETTPLWEKWFDDVKEMLPKDEFESAWERGKTLDLVTEFDKLRAEFGTE